MILDGLTCGQMRSAARALLLALLGEMRTLGRYGGAHRAGVVGYAGQHAWLRRGTVRENILFGQPLEQPRCVTRSNLSTCRRYNERRMSLHDAVTGTRTRSLLPGCSQTCSGGWPAT